MLEDLDGNEERVAKHIEDSGANLLCVRTSSAKLQDLVPVYHQMGLRVYGWKWAHVVPSSPTDPYFVVNETKHVVNDLIPAGLDGYIFDIESDDGHPPTPHDWDNRDIRELTAYASMYAYGIQTGLH
jgi:hypothetical protein